MGTILESAKLIFTEKNVSFKIAVLSFLLLTIYNIHNKYFTISKDIDLILIAVLGLIYIGYLFQTLNNSLEEKSYILSKINISAAFIVGLKGTLSCGIFIVPLYYLNKWFEATLPPNVLSSIILMIIGYLLAGSFLVTSIIYYGKNLKILSGLNIIKILKSFHEIVVYLTFLTISLIIANGIISVPIYFISTNLFGFGQLHTFIMAMIITYNCLICAHNLSLAYFDQIDM